MESSELRGWIDHRAMMLWVSITCLILMIVGVTIAVSLEGLSDDATLPLSILVGAVGAVLILRYGGFNASASTSDEYVRAFHERNPSMPLHEVPGKLAAGITTLGLGGAVGLEGPSIYAGSALAL